MLSIFRDETDGRRNLLVALAGTVAFAGLAVFAWLAFDLGLLGIVALAVLYGLLAGWYLAPGATSGRIRWETDDVLRAWRRNRTARRGE